MAVKANLLLEAAFKEDVIMMPHMVGSSALCSSFCMKIDPCKTAPRIVMVSHSLLTLLTDIVMPHSPCGVWLLSVAKTDAADHPRETYYLNTRRNNTFVYASISVYHGLT